MVGSGILLVVLFIGLLVYATAYTKEHGGFLTEKQPETWLFVAGFLVSGIMYLLGFVRYATSKGYSGWLAFWLLLGQLYGFVTLFLLPDLNSTKDDFRNR